MSSKRFFSLASLFVIVSMVLAACGGAADTPVPPTDTAVAVAPTAMAPTAMAPTATAMTAMTPTAMTAMTPTVAPTPAAVITATDTLYGIADCNSGGYMGTVKTIEAVDDTTVKFTLCSPDPAF